MSKKGIIVGLFVRKDNTLSVLESIKKEYNIPIDKIFVYSIEGNDKEYLMTFKSPRKDVNSVMRGSTIMHVRNGCVFSINALNRLIKDEYGEEVNPNDIELDWQVYKDKMIILTNGFLNICSISKIEDKCKLLSN